MASIARSSGRAKRFGRTDMSLIHLPKPEPSNHSRRLKAHLPNDYEELFVKADETIRKLTAPYPRATRIYELLSSDPRVQANWEMSNYTAVSKLNYNDHGPIHARVTASYLAQIMVLLHEAGVPFDVVESGTGTYEDAFVVGIAGILLHDIGNALHRLNHEPMGVIMGQLILERTLPRLYGDSERMQLIENFILSAIQCHDMNPPPLFMEGAVVAVADGCDMSKGRARMPFDLGKIDIHAVSALSIEAVRILRGENMPVEIHVDMSNSAGIFQVEEILVKKLNLTPLRQYVTVKASTITPGGRDQRIVDSVILKDGRLRPL